MTRDHHFDMFRMQTRNKSKKVIVDDPYDFTPSDNDDSSPIVGSDHDDISGSNDSDDDNESAPKLKMQKTKRNQVVHFNADTLYKIEPSRDVLKASYISQTT